MNIDSGNPYPGSNASTSDMLELADMYYGSALTLFKDSEGSSQLSRAPARLCAIHGIELYLNAFLMHRGIPAETIRSYHHSFEEIMGNKFMADLILKKRTVEHLITMTERREYLITRYGPEMVSTHTELNRLTVTLVEVATKVRKYIG